MSSLVVARHSVGLVAIWSRLLSHLCGYVATRGKAAKLGHVATVGCVVWPVFVGVSAL